MSPIISGAAPWYHAAVTSRFVVSALSIFVIAACGSAPPRQPNTPNAAATAPKGPASHVETARDRLAAQLRGIAPEGPVLDAVPPALRGALDGLVGRLDAEHLAALTRVDGPVAAERPLLHLAAHGESQTALLALATTGRGADELVDLAGGASGKLDALPAVVAAIGRRAAELWLHDRAADLSGGEELPVELLDAVDRAAATLGRLDVERAAREVAARIENTAGRHLDVADAAAWQLDADGAARELAVAKQLDKDGTFAAPAARAAHWVELARLAASAKTAKLDAKKSVEVAWAFIELHRAKDALGVLVPHRAEAEHDLGLAAALALATADGGICPGLGGAANVAVCAAAWDKSAAVEKSVAVLGRAWESKQGRDDRSIEAWLGYTFVVPWIYSTVGQTGSREDAERAFRGRMQALERGAKEASDASHAFDGLLLFTDTLAAGFEAAGKRKPNVRVMLPPPVQTELERRARELGARSPDQRFTQAGVLGVAAMLAQERDILPLVKLLPEALPHDLEAPRAELRLWSAVARRSVEEAERARSEIAAVLPGIEDSMTRSRLVLTLAEANVALTHSTEAYAVLGKVAAQLVDPRVPAELRLRAAIDDAGALARQNQEKDAETLLEQVTTTTLLPPGSSTEHDLADLAQGYLLVLRSRAAAGDARKDYRDKLQHLLDGDAGAPASVTLWRDLWVAELDHLAKVDQCGALKCAGQRRKADPARIDAAVGAESGRVVRGGTFAAGTVRLWFDYSGAHGLRAVVVLEPRLLAVEFPPAD